jgi:hypothetical protein
MTDREILAAIRRHCAEASNEIAEAGSPLSATEARRLVGYLDGTLSAIIGDLSHMKCDRCESRTVDGSGIMCRECWVETSDVQP